MRNTVTIPYPDDLLLSLKVSPEHFETEARLLLAIKLYEMGRITTGLAARLAGMDRVAFFSNWINLACRRLASTLTS